MMITIYALVDREGKPRACFTNREHAEQKASSMPYTKLLPIPVFEQLEGYEELLEVFAEIFDVSEAVQAVSMRDSTRALVRERLDDVYNDVALRMGVENLDAVQWRRL